MRERAVFFDRDGVINELVPPTFARGPRSVQELVLKPGIKELIPRLVQLDFMCIVITNQPDVSRGKLSNLSLKEIHEQLLESVPGIDRIYICPHDNHEDCSCRKPKPGLIERAILDFKINASKSYFVGDRWTDILAAHLSGVSSVLLSNPLANEGGSQGPKPEWLEPNFTINNVSDLLSIVS
jgi:D-glycero-D-manno-heptose 1,7-bisphosphate phosphatase